MMCCYHGRLQGTSWVWRRCSAETSMSFGKAWWNFSVPWVPECFLPHTGWVSCYGTTSSFSGFSSCAASSAKSQPNRSEPIGTDRNRPESRPKLRSRHLVFSFFKANLPSMNRPRSAHVGRLGRVAGVLAGALWGLSIEGAALSLRASLSRPWASKINRFIQFENWLINPCFLILPLCKLIYITVIMCFMLLFSSFCWMLFHLNLGGQEKSEANLNELILPQRA